MTNELRQAIDDLMHHVKYDGDELRQDYVGDSCVKVSSLRLVLAAVEQLDAVEKERDGYKAALSEISGVYHDPSIIRTKRLNHVVGVAQNILARFRAIPDPCTLCHTPIPRGAELYATGTDEDAGPYCSVECRDKAERKMDGGGE